MENKKTEIGKLYENARIEKIHNCKGCEYEEEYICPDNCPQQQLIYPLFTAEKQLELIKLLAHIEDVLITYYPCDKEYNIRYCVAGWYDGSVSGSKDITSNTFEESLAGLVNSLWQDLTEEKEQIRGILNG